MTTTTSTTSSSSDTASQERSFVTHGAPTWLEIPATDVGRAKRFFGRVFRWPFKGVPPGYDCGEEQMVMFDNADARLAKLGIGGIIVRVDAAEKLTRGKNAVLVYLMVDDLDDTLVRVEEEGGKVVVAKMPEGDHGFLAQFEDTEGNWWGVYQVKK